MKDKKRKQMYPVILKAIAKMHHDATHLKAFILIDMFVTAQTKGE